MADVHINGDLITDWPTFHRVFAEALGFPLFYGNNMNAWIDCLTYLREATGMARVVLTGAELLTLSISGTESLSKRCPEPLSALVECVAAVNRRYVFRGEPPAVHLLLT